MRYGHDGVMTMPSTRTGRPPMTSRANILRAARSIIDSDGWTKLTLRRLARDLGVGTTTLYHHVGDKDELQVMLVADHLSRIERPEFPVDARERIVAAAVLMRTGISAWPWVAEALSIEGFFARLGESGLWLVEIVVSAAVECGCTPEDAVSMWHALSYYTVGEVSIRARWTDREGAAGEAENFSAIDADSFPTLATIGSAWPALARRDIYGDGLHALVHGLLDQMTHDAGTGRQLAGEGSTKVRERTS